MTKVEHPKRLHIRKNKSIHPTYNLLGDTVKKAWSKVSADVNWYNEQRNVDVSQRDSLVTGVSQEIQDLVTAVARVYEASIRRGLADGSLTEEQARKTLDFVLQQTMSDREIFEAIRSGELSKEEAAAMADYGTALRDPSAAGTFLRAYGQHSGVSQYETIGRVLEETAPPLIVDDGQGNNVLASLDPITSDLLNTQIHHGNYARVLRSVRDREGNQIYADVADKVEDAMRARAQRASEARDTFLRQRNIEVDLYSQDVESLYNRWATGGTGLDIIAATLPNAPSTAIRFLSGVLNYGDIVAGSVHRTQREVQHEQDGEAPGYHPLIQGLVDHATTAAQLQELELSGAPEAELEQARQAYRQSLDQVQTRRLEGVDAAMNAAAMHELTTQAATMMQRTTSGALMPRFNAVANAGVKVMERGIPSNAEEAAEFFGDVAGRAFIEAQVSQQVAQRAVRPLRELASPVHERIGRALEPFSRGLSRTADRAREVGRGATSRVTDPVRRATERVRDAAQSAVDRTRSATQSVTERAGRSSPVARKLQEQWGRIRQSRQGVDPSQRLNQAATRAQRTPNAATPRARQSAQAVQPPAPSASRGALHVLRNWGGRLLRGGVRTAGRLAGPVVGAYDLYEGHTQEGQDRIGRAVEDRWAQQNHTRGLLGNLRGLGRDALSIPEAVILGDKDRFQGAVTDINRLWSPNLREERRLYQEQLNMDNNLLEQQGRLLPEIERSFPGMHPQHQRHLAAAAAANFVDVQAGRIPEQREYNEFDDLLLQSIEERVGQGPAHQVRSLIELAGPEAVAEVLLTEDGRIRPDTLQPIIAGESLNIASPFLWRNPYDEQRRVERLEQQRLEQQQARERSAAERSAQNAEWEQQRSQRAAEMEQRRVELDRQYQQAMQEVRDSNEAYYAQQQTDRDRLSQLDTFRAGERQRQVPQSPSNITPTSSGSPTADNLVIGAAMNRQDPYALRTVRGALPQRAQNTARGVTRWLSRGQGVNPAPTAQDRVQHWQQTGQWDSMPEGDRQQWRAWQQPRPGARPNPAVDLGSSLGENVPTPTVNPRPGS